MKTADLIIRNANVYTVDQANPTADTVAVQGNQIVYVGDEASAVGLIGDETRVIDGQGRTLLPGLIDAHYHLLWGSMTLYGAQLYAVRTLDDLRDALQTWANENPDAPFVIGQGMTYGVPDSKTPLTRHHLDEIIADRPIILTAFDQHSCFANTKALAAAGILQGANAPMANGDVVMGADGLATGELYEMDAMDAIKAALPEPTFDEQIEILKQGLELAASYGITSVHNMDGDVEQTGVYAHLEAQNELTLRVYMPFWVKPEMETATMVEQASIMRERYNSAMVRGGAVKFFMDGVYESHTAVSVKGFADKPDAFGEPIWSAERFAEFVTLADSMGLQIAVHACGDGAVRRVLDGYEAAQQANGVRDSRHRVEHIELIQASDIPRFAELGVVASMQPLHSPLDGLEDGDVWLQRIYDAEYDRAFAWRALRDADAKIAFGSDWPVVTADPYPAIWGTVTRKPLSEDGKDQTQTLEEAIRAYTADAAWTEFQEDVKGQIKVGMLADLVLLSDNIFALEAAKLKDISAEITICNGRIVYEKQI
ncbi:MAG: amidohydrolase [Candidatus Promineifilaceae bacterium]